MGNSLRKYADHERPGAVCYDCRRPYGTFPDMLVSDDVWETINPTHHRGCGLLCPTCMAVRVLAAGLDHVPAAFVSAPFVPGIVASEPGQAVLVVPAEEWRDRHLDATVRPTPRIEPTMGAGHED